MLNKIIDAHQHFLNPDRFQYPWMSPERRPLKRTFLPEDLMPILKRLEIDTTIAVQAIGNSDETDWLLELTADHEFIDGVVGWVDLTDPGLSDVLHSLKQHKKFKGVRHIWEDEPDPAWIMRNDILKGLREVAKHGIPYDLLVKPVNWEYIPKIAQAVPDLRLVIDHMAKPSIRDKQFDDWAIMMAKAAEFPQMHCKVSGLITEAVWKKWKPSDLKPYVEKVIEIFGVNRLIFGSDWPVCLLAGTYEQMFHALQECLEHLDQREKSLILGRNAANFYSIS